MSEELTPQMQHWSDTIDDISSNISKITKEIPETEFAAVYLPLFLPAGTSGLDDKRIGEITSLWVSRVAGHHTAPVNILNDKNEIVCVAPPLIDTGALELLSEEHDPISDIAEKSARQTANMPGLQDRYFDEQIDSLTESLVNSDPDDLTPAQKQRVELWQYFKVVESKKTITDESSDDIYE